MIIGFIFGLTSGFGATFGAADGSGLSFGASPCTSVGFSSFGSIMFFETSLLT